MEVEATQISCRYCKKKMIVIDKKDIEKVYQKHLETCKKYKNLLEQKEIEQKFKDAGCLDEMKLFYKRKAVYKDLKKLVKKYGYETVERELELLEEEQ